MGKLDEAIADFIEALKWDPYTRNGRVFLSAALLGCGRVNEAEEGKEYTECSVGLIL